MHAISIAETTTFKQETSKEKSWQMHGYKV